jgi:phosphatidylglycerol lysyltransferase
LMRANPSDTNEAVTENPPAPPKRLRPREWVSKHRQPIGLGVTILLFAIALIACRHMLTELDIYALQDSLLSVPLPSLAGAVLATAIGFVILLGYEWSASRYANVELPAKSLVMGGFCAFAIGNAVGLSMLSGGSVRYRLYSRLGLGAGEVAHMTLFASLSLGCALPPLAALATLSDLPAASLALHMSVPVLATIAVAVLAISVILGVAVYRRRLPEQTIPHNLLVRAGRRTLRLPGVRLTLMQLVITALDVAAAAAVLYLLLPSAPPFGAFLLVYLLALAAGVLSHVPGGVGVFEAILLAAFADELGAAPLAAALLLYRLIYVVLPLLIACLVLLYSEAKRLLFAQQAMRVASGLGAPILALLVFLSGVVLLFSGSTPEIDTRLESLGFLIPHRLIDGRTLPVARARLAPPSFRSVDADHHPAVRRVHPVDPQRFRLGGGKPAADDRVPAGNLSALVLPAKSLAGTALLAAVSGCQRVRTGRVGLAVALRLPGRALQPSAVVAVHAGCRCTAWSALGSGQRGSAVDRFSNVATAHGAPGDQSAG